MCRRHLHRRHRQVVTGGHAGASGVTTFRPSALQRALFVAIGLAGTVLFVGLGLANSPAMALFAIPAVVVIFEGLRARVDLDLDHRVVASSRAIRRTVVPIDDIVNVRVPPWGPVALTLRPGAPKPGGGIWPGQVLTGIYADHRGADGVASELASLLNVPVVSVWRGVRSDQGPDSERPD